MRYLFGAIAVFACAASVVLSEPREAAAHPSGTYTINRYARLELYRHSLRIHYVADYSELPSLQWQISNDGDGDGVISAAELQSFLEGEPETLLANLHVSVGAEELRFTTVAKSASFQKTDLGVETLRYEVEFGAQVEVSGEQEVSFADENFAGIGGWRAITISPSVGTYEDAGEALRTDPSQGLTTYPEEWKTFRPNVRRLAFSWDPATGGPLPAAAPAIASEVPKQTGRDLSGSGFAIALLTAALLGLIDALGPGHGKTVAGAYLSSQRGANLRDLVALSATSAFVHGAVITTFGFLAVQATSLLVPDAARWLGLFAGSAVAALGSVLLLARVLGWRTAWTERFHVHMERPRSLGGAVAVGAVAALIPCPTGIVLLLGAVASGALLQGFALALAFSAGTGVALFLVGGAVSLAWRLRVGGGASDHFARAASAVPIVAGLAMIGSGLFVLSNAWSGNVL